MLACPLSQCLYERTISIKQTYIFIHSECLFLARVPLSHMQIQSCDSHMERRCGSSLSVWKVGGKEAFSWSESTVNQALHPAQLFCKWIRSSGIILWIPWGQTDTDNCIFHFLCFASPVAYVCALVWYLCWSSKSFFVSFFLSRMVKINDWMSKKSYFSQQSMCEELSFISHSSEVFLDLFGRNVVLSLTKM